MDDLFEFLNTIEIPAAPEWIEDLAKVPDEEEDVVKIVEERGGVCMWNEANHKYSYFKSHADLEDFVYLTPIESRTHHKRIYANQPQKLRFDIDAKAIDTTHTFTLAMFSYAQLKFIL